MLIQPEQKAHILALVHTEDLPNMELAGLLLQGLGATWSDIGMDEEYFLNELGTGKRKNIFWANKLAKVAQLDLRELLKRVGLADLGFEKVLDFEQKGSVWVSDENADKLACLGYLKNINTLRVRMSTHNFLEKLPSLPWLKYLNIVTDDPFPKTAQDLSLHFLEKFPNLETLGLEGAYGNKGSTVEISPLSNLLGLRQLVIRRYRILDITPLRCLTNLVTLTLVKAEISDLSGWKGADFPYLKSLDLSENQLSSVDKLPKLPSLCKLNLETNNLQQAQCLKAFQSLKELKISNNQLVQVQGLAHIPKLELANNQLEDLSGFKSPKNAIEYLDIRQNPFQQGVLFRYFPKLRRFFSDNLQGWGEEAIAAEVLILYAIFLQKSGLYLPIHEQPTLRETADFYKQPFRYLFKDKTQFQCNKKQLSRLSFLDCFDMLETLSCANNQISSLQDLQLLKQKDKLQSLDCSQNQLRELPNLEDFKGLEILKCASNPIENLAQIADIQKLKHLECADTMLQDLSPFQSAQHLEYLDISRTQVSNLEHLRNCQKLKSLNCRRLVLESLEPLYGLPLQRLALSPKQLPPVVLAEFRQKNPSCKIKFG